MKRLLLFLLVGFLVLGMATGCQIIEQLLGGNGDPIDDPNGNGDPTDDPNGNGDPTDDPNGNGDEPAGPETVLAAIVGGDVVLINDEDDITPVTSTGDVTWVGWSPDGSKLLIYREAGQLWTMDADGSGLSLLTGGVAFDSYHAQPGYLWHPDSNHVGCVLEGTSEVHVFNLTAGTSQVFDFGHSPIEGPWWSQSGHMAVLVSREVDDPASLRDEWWEEEQDYEDYYIRRHLKVLNLDGDEIFEHQSVAKVAWAGDNLFYTGYNVSFIQQMPFQDGIYALAAGDDTPEYVSRFGGMAIGALGNNLVAYSTARDIMVYNFANNTLAGPVYSQDYFITYSEFEYPFVFAPAYHANQLAVLALTLESEEGAWPQIGYWDLDVYDWDTGSSWTVWPEVFILDELPTPLQYTISFFWSWDGEYIYVFQEDGDDQQLWEVAADGSGGTRMILPDCDFVASRPLDQ